MFNVEASLSGTRGKFKALIDYLLGEGQAGDAYRAEVKVFRELLAIGLFLMAAWFLKKLGGNVGKAIVTEAGEELPREARKPRRYITIFGELPVLRWFYHRAGSPGLFPLDQEANLPVSTYSYFVQDILGEDVTGETFDEALGGAGRFVKSGDGTLVIAGPQDYAPGALWDVLGGTMVLETDAGSMGADLSISVLGAELRFACNQHLDTLTIGDGGLVRFTGANVVVLKHLVMDGIDLGAMTLTPEPATLALLAFGGLALLRRRRAAA